MTFKLKYKVFGEHSLLVEWPQKINTSILYDILGFKLKIQNAFASEILSLNHAYTSLIIVFVNEAIDFNSKIEHLKVLYLSSEGDMLFSKKLWHIPVCYDSSFGIDLETLSKAKQLPVDKIVALHTAPVYTIYFIGFLPGFLYLGGLDKELYTPRRQSPRLKIEKGAVAIGSEQTGVYPSESPGGWQIIGNSPINFFNVKKQTPCFAKAGDALKFYPVTLKTYSDIKTLVEAGVYQIESEVIND